jgi:L-asparaginase / beta-aspartyl-peptidase
MQFDYLIPPMGMDKCCANNVDNNNVHKADMVMNGLHISVYASETLGWCGGHVHRRLMSKMLGRIGDSPPIKFGTYRCDACAVSCTLKWDMATFMEYKGLPLQQAVDYYVRA